MLQYLFSNFGFKEISNWPDLLHTRPNHKSLPTITTVTAPESIFRGSRQIPSWYRKFPVRAKDCGSAR